MDGPGIRTTVFFKGCNLECAWCHNPESQSSKIQMMIYKNKCTGCGKCKEHCPYDLNKCDLCGKCTYFCPQDARQICGQKYSVDQLLEEVIKDRSIYVTSNGGVTFSGGECMLQIDFLKEILKKCKENEVHTAVDTAGNVPWDDFEKIIPYTDLFLYDLKCMKESLHREGTGVSNGLILKNLKNLSESFKGDIMIRVPVIPGFNDSFDEMEQIADFLKGINYKTVELLPYHKMGEHKYEALGRNHIPYMIPEKESMEKFGKLFTPPL